MSTSESYRPIRDYALIGDAHTAALVASNGSIDWCCWPHFDSPAIFCRLLDARRGGFFRIGPVAAHTASRSYVRDTSVLTTTFRMDGGVARVTDFMPVGVRRRSLLRLIEGISGAVDFAVCFRPTFDYARTETSVAPCPGGAVARADREGIRLAGPVVLHPDLDGGVRGRLHVRGDTRHWFALSSDSGLPDAKLDDALTRTITAWESWSAACDYEGPYADLVRRSALVLKLLTFEPTGALVAAPTTSLPEEIGGVRNWDYRFTWLRDSALILYALMSLGHHDEAHAFFDWIERACAKGREGRRQIVYRIDGSHELPEEVLEHLEGYRASRPVRVGNDAADQVQFDASGELIDAAHFCFESMHRPFGDRFAAVLGSLAEQAALHWRDPDQGIWEVRTEPRHFVHSKLLCWLALDRALRLAEEDEGLAGDRRWRVERDAIREAILSRGFDARLGAFTQSLGESTLDASALMLPLVGFLPASDPRMVSTVDRIRERLTSHGLVYRYHADDGLPGGEATFALCSFWLVDNLALQGRIDEARELFEGIVGYANDVGLLSEQIDPESGDLLGNHPQGYSHLALIRSALHIAAAEERRSHRPGRRANVRERASHAASSHR